MNREPIEFSGTISGAVTGSMGERPDAISLLVRLRNLYADGFTMSSSQWHAMVAEWDSLLDAAGVQKVQVAEGVQRWADPATA